MKKRFNITGVCYPHSHYMMDVAKKKEQVMANFCFPKDHPNWKCLLFSKPRTPPLGNFN